LHIPLHGRELKLEDRSILASGNHADRDLHILTLRDVPAKIQSLRLEVLPDDSLPNMSPKPAPQRSRWCLTT
jgi:hypothetical protein